MINSEVEDLNDYKGSKPYSYFKPGWLSNTSYHSLTQVNIVYRKVTAALLRDSPHKLWVCLPKKEGKVITVHCTCVAVMSSTCNHVAAVLFHVEAAIRLGLTNPVSITKACEWFPNRKYVKPVKIKDLNFNRGDFAKRGKKRKKFQILNEIHSPTIIRKHYLF